MLCKNRDWKSLKVVLELPLDDEENEHKFFQPLISSFWSVHEMTDVVQQLLNAFIFTNQGSAHD